ncbi:fibronectin type III domain-containing protein [Treponema sp.]|uniref:fibronectin type III domain-containing protein n=1 Tax=Treponema sp. TaxID=166 RepID=UPI00257BBBE8|nr:fibronectin type III domain-containing protein [Treponema sp.]
MTRFTKLFSLPVIAGLLLAGCSDSGGGSSDSTPGISITCGTTLQITDAVPLSTMENTISAIQKNSTADLKWTSSDENIIKITNTASAAPKLIIYQEGTSTLAVSFTENGSTYSAECNATVTFKDASESSPSFIVDEITDHSAALNWTAADNVTYEKFLLLTYKGTDLLSKEELGSSAVTKTLSALDPETEYTAKLYGIYSGGTEYTVSSETFSTTADTTAPGSVTFNEEKITANAAEEAITLYWSNPADTDLAKIVISISSTEDSTVFDDIELTTASYLKAGATNLSKKITGLMDSIEGTPYTFTIKTYDNAGNHDESFDVSKTFSTKADPAPALVTLTPSSTESRVGVSWYNPSDTDIASIKATITSTEDTTTDLESKAMEFTSATQVKPSTQITAYFNYLLTDGTDGVEYTVTVILTDKKGHSNAGTTITISTLKDSTAPEEVSITSVKTRASSIALTWTNPSDSDFEKTIASIYDSSDTMVGEAVTQTGSAKGSQSYSFTGLTEGETYSVKIQTVDIWGNTSTGTTKTITAENPAVASVSAVTGFSGQAVVSWTDCDEDGLSYVVSAKSQTTEATIPDPIIVAEGKQKIAVSGLDIGTAYTFTVTPKDDEGTYTAVESGSLSPVAVIWQLKSGYEERMIHPAVLVDDYSKGYVTASSMHIIASDHSDKAAGPDVSRSSAKYDNWVVLPGLADPTNPDYFSLVADATQKYLEDDTTGATSTVPSPSNYYIYFDTDGSHEPIPAGSANSSWGERSLDAYNAESNRMWIGEKSEISDLNNATFYIVDQSDVTKNPTGDNDTLAYQPYVYFKSTGGLFWQHSWCIFLGVSQVSDSPCAAIARQIYTYSEAITLPE